MSYDLNTEEKIKVAAAKIFEEKGFERTKNKDIADAAGINPALLNYYFRSKEKLFNAILLDKIQTFIGLLFPVLNDPDVALLDKIEILVNRYFALLKENPNLAIFIMNELQTNKSNLVQILKNLPALDEVSIIKQLKNANTTVTPLQFMINLMSMTIFPFILANAISAYDIFNKEEVDAIFEERRKMIPIWITEMLKIQSVKTDGN
jgi:AcrR family transcriptional regulator